MAAFSVDSLVEGIAGAAFRLPIHVVPGETLDLGNTGSGDGDTLCHSPS
jgi:hypothetical protein